MAFVTDKEVLKPGLIIFRRADVDHRNWYCRVKLPKADRYKTVSLKTSDINAARELAFDQDSDVRFRLKHDVPVFNHPFHFYRGQVPLHDYVDLLGRTPGLEARNGAMLPAHNDLSERIGRALTGRRAMVGGSDAHVEPDRRQRQPLESYAAANAGQRRDHQRRDPENAAGYLGRFP